VAKTQLLFPIPFPRHTNTTLPFVEHMAEAGVANAIREDPILAAGVNIWRGEIVCDCVAESLGLSHRDLGELV
jgi:alanine dehydrogenase